jgi:hypothetical protein
MLTARRAVDTTAARVAPPPRRSCRSATLGFAFMVGCFFLAHFAWPPRITASLMRYLLDRNAVSDLVREPRGRVAAKVLEVGEAEVCTSIVVAAELRFGASKKGSARLTRQLEAVLGACPWRTGCGSRCSAPRRRASPLPSACRSSALRLLLSPAVSCQPPRLYTFSGDPEEHEQADARSGRRRFLCRAAGRATAAAHAAR